MNRWRVVSLLAALLVGGFALSMAESPSYAQTATGNFDATRTVSHEERVFRFRKFLENTKPSDFNSSAEATRRQHVLTRASRPSVGALKPALRFGLAGVAAGIWIHNGVTLWNAAQCGETTCEPLEMDAAFQQATDAADASAGVGTGGGVARAYSYGTLKATTIINGVEIDYDAGSRASTTTVRYSVERASDWSAGKTAGDMGCVTVSGSGAAGCTGLTFTGSGDKTFVSGPTTWSSPLPQGTSTMYTMDWENGTAKPQKPFGGTITGWSDYKWENPVYDWMETVPGSLPASGTTGGRSPVSVSPAESDALYDATVADPEAPPADPFTDEPIETVPDFFPEEWEEEFPDINQPGKEDDPYGDPDQDGEPNHQDGDDDGDEIPDEDDTEPFGLPVEWPSADPDGDGIPNEDDPDDDGDGIPDSDDPEPYTPTDPTTLPDDHPYSDPDEDGSPNRTDTDDDGDGIPDTSDPEPYTPTDPATLPDDHPYADPDGDGVPNKDDSDDDGDGIPDSTDPNPTTPDVDTDGDGIPDSTDPDDDGDGIPDETDPNPTTPDVDTDSDEVPDELDRDDDGDGVDDWKDRGPLTTSFPANPLQDTDTDSVPDFEDPWPSEQGKPADPTQDRDADGVPDYQDPEPSQEAVPVSPTEPGNTNIPSNPTNPNYPTNDRWPLPNPEDNTAPAEYEPSCPIAPKPSMDLPEVPLHNIFPFNLIVWVWGALGQLAGTATAPTIGFFGFSVDTGPIFDPYIGVIRGAIGLVFLCGMLFWFYKSITGKGGEA